MSSSQLQSRLAMALMLLPVMTHAQSVNQKNNQNKNVMSNTQSNKEVVRKIYEEVLNKRNMALLDQLVSENFTDQRGEKGVAAFLVPTKALINGFPDIQWKLEALIGEGDQVVAKWSVQATHTATFGNFTATGKAVSNEGMGIFELKDNKVIKTHILTDRVTFLQQIGVLPTDLTSIANKNATKDNVYFIDKFLIPAPARKEFYERMNINRNMIKDLPGFIDDAAYEYTDGNGNLVCVTVAMWANHAALQKAKETVQAEYKKQGFDAAAMMKRLNITADRGIYTAVAE